MSSSSTTPKRRKLNISAKSDKSNEHKKDDGGIADKPFRFMDLPNEIKDMILAYAKFPDLCRLRSASRGLRSFIPKALVEASLEEVVKDCGYYRAKLCSPDVIERYTDNDRRLLYKSAPCFGCTMLRPTTYFGKRWYLEQPRTIHDYLSLYYRSKAFAQAFNEAPPTLSPKAMCYECAIVHPDYLDTNGRGLRWILAAESTIVVCVECNELKMYKLSEGKQNSILPVHRQASEDLCHECWRHHHLAWHEAKAQVGERLKELRRESDLMNYYKRWMDQVDLANPRSSAVDGARLLKQEPRRGSFLEKLPDWSNELCLHTGLPVPDID